MSHRAVLICLTLLLAGLSMPTSAVEAQAPAPLAGGGPGTGWALVDLDKGPGWLNITVLTGWHSSPRAYGMVLYDVNRTPLVHLFTAHEPTGAQHVVVRAEVGDDAWHVEPWLRPTSTHIGVRFTLTDLPPGTYQVLTYVAGGANSWSYNITGAGAVELSSRTGDRTFFAHVKEFEGPALLAVRTPERDVAAGVTLAKRIDVQDTFVGVFYRDPQTAAVMTVEPPGGSATVCAPIEPMPGGGRLAASCVFPEQRSPFALGPGAYEFTWSSVSAATPGAQPLAYVGGADVDFG